MWFGCRLLSVELDISILSLVKEISFKDKCSQWGDIVKSRKQKFLGLNKKTKKSNFGKNRKFFWKFPKYKKWLFVIFKKSITFSSGWVRVIFLCGFKSLEEIFPTPPCLQIFDTEWGRYAYRKLGCWIEEGPIRILARVI